MRVLHVLPLITARAGGPVAFATEGAEALASLGVHSTLFSTNLGHSPSSGHWRTVDAHELPANAEALDLKLFPVSTPRRFAYSPAMAREISRTVSGYDLVHVHSLWLYPQFAAHRGARRAGIPIVVSPHGALDPYLRQRGRGRKLLTNVLWQDRMLKEARILHITTVEEGELIADVAPDVPREIVPVGVWTDRLMPHGDPARFRAAHLGGHEGDIILFLGRLTFKKGIDVLIRAFATIADAFPDTRLAIAGPDDEALRPTLEALAVTEGIAGQVIFTGPLYREDRADALAAATVWALSSHTENFGVAVIEALAAGIPTVISTEVNLASTAQRDNAALVAPVEPAAFGAALRKVLADPALQRELAANARRYAQRFDWTTVGPQMRDMYERALRV